MAASDDAGIPGPAVRRRALAWTALGAMTLAVIMLGVFLVRNAGLLLLGLVGLMVAAAGAWWTITEQPPRRWLGAVALPIGLLLVAGSILAATADSRLQSVEMLATVILLSVAAISARFAMAPELHLLDQLRHATPARPKYPVLLCNPRSGGGKIEQFDLVGHAQELGVETVEMSPGEDLAQLAQDAVDRGADCLGIAGGDGSQSVVAGVAVTHGLPMVIISAGTRNHFAQDLGLDTNDPREGLRAFVDGVERHVDYGTANGRVFVNNVSLGLYAELVRDDRYRDAKVDVSLELLPELAGPSAEPFDLSFTLPDGREVSGAFLVLVSNNPYVLGLSPDASQRLSLDTGQLGVFAITADTGTDFALAVASFTVGLGRIDPRVHELTADEFEVASRSHPIRAAVDGEPVDLAAPLTIRIHPKSLRLMVPRENLLVVEQRAARGFSLSDLVSVAQGRHTPRVLKLAIAQQQR